MTWRTRTRRLLRTPEDSERGSMHVMTIPITVGLLVVAIGVITMVGSATNDRRQTGTAADAAAIAATQEWDDHLGLLHGVHLAVPEPAGFWELAEEALLTDEVEDRMYEAATAYAEANGAELVDLDVDGGRLTVTAEVRHEHTVPGTEFRSTASATAGIRMRGGLCLGEDGLGWLIDGECMTEAEPQKDGDKDEDGGKDGEKDGGKDKDKDGDGEKQDEEKEPWSPPDVDDYTSRIVLVG